MKDDVDLKTQGAAVSKPPGRSGDRPSLIVDRLLRSAAESEKDAPTEAPFGFDTRVVALWRAQPNDAALGITRFVRRVAVAAVAVIVLSAGAAYRELNQTSEKNELVANEFAIADSVIQDEFLP
jgi:hypothetical protein